MQKCMKLFVTCSLLMMLMVLIGVTAYADEIRSATVTGSAVNLRGDSELDAPVLASVKKDTTVGVIGPEDDGWYRVSTNGKIGYMSAEYLEIAEDSADVVGTVTGSYVYIRAAASGSGKILGGLSRGAEVRVSGLENGWYRVSRNGVSGYMSADYVALGEAAAPVGGEQVVAIAKQYLGYRYVYGASSPSVGFDCSGLVTYVYKKYNGYTFKCRTQLYLDGVSVQYANLQPGDLVFFDTVGRGNITHVGIYIGNGQMIHAPNSRSCVKIVSIEPGTYYYQRYKGARRVL